MNNHQEKINYILSSSSNILIGKSKPVKLALCCLLAQGHLLIEDVPGVGKTTLALFFKKVFGCDFKRVQLTSDLLPADITGNTVFNPQTLEFELHKGAIFANLVLADELNRATPKTQSAFLEAMEERSVSIDRETYKLELPFWVIATQNPKHQIGTFFLPESQLERFLMHIDIGYPHSDDELDILKGIDPRSRIDDINTVFAPSELNQLFTDVSAIKISDEAVSYVQRILKLTREESHKLECFPLSPRTGRDIVRAAKSWAFLDGRDFVLPDDVREILPFVTRHRLVSQELGFKVQGERIVNDIINQVPIHI